MSWYPTPELKTQAQKKYINDIQTIFRVMNPRRQWIPYKLEPHQIEWHLGDIALHGPQAKHKIAVKSRNTSFTVSSVISMLASVPFYPNQVIPVVRLNQMRANDLISDIKNIIKHINVIKEEDGRLFPFNPELVNMDNASSIKFPNGVEIRAFPATNSAAEIIRGLRIAGFAGLIDECNFMKDFWNIYIALRDAAAGSIDGDVEYQIVLGTTRKGRATPFNLWFENIERLQPDNMKIYKWPVFNPVNVNYEKPFTEQNLKPIVKWHSVKDLENKRKESLPRFKEEYMAELVDSDEQFYEWDVVQQALQLSEKYNIENGKGDVHGKIYIGIDPATGVGKDYFSVSIFELINGMKLQRYVYYTKKQELPQMELFCIDLIKQWNPFKVRVDYTGPGTHIAQKLIQTFGSGIVEPVRGNMTIKGVRKNLRIKMKEFLHTNQKQLMSNGEMSLLNDEVQIQHYTAWNINFEAESGVMGHGDIVISNGLATLPDNFKFVSGKSKVNMNIGKDLQNQYPIETIKQSSSQIEVEWDDDDDE